MRAVEFLNEKSDHERMITQRLKSILIVHRASGEDSISIPKLRDHMNDVNLSMTPIKIKQVVSGFPFVDEITDDEIHFVTVDDFSDDDENNKKVVQNLAKKAVDRGVV